MTNRDEHTANVADPVFRKIFAESPVGMALVSTSYRFLRVNAELCRITGYSESELLARTFVDITHPEDVESDVALARRLASGEIPHYQMEKRYIRKDGQAVWILLGGSVVRDDSGAPLYFVATIQDISAAKSADTVRRELESRLRESEERHRQTLDAIDDFIFVKDRHSRLVWANRAFCDYYGMSVAELSGRLDAPTTPADVTSAYLEADALVLQRGATQVIEDEPIVRHDGTVRRVNTVKSPLRGTDGGVVGLVGVARDLTESNRLRDELARSERYHRAIIESSRDMLLVVDREGRNVYVSPANQRLTGWTPEERLGRESFELVHPEDLSRVKAALESLLRDPSYSATIEYRWQCRDGSWMWLEAVGRNLLDDPAVGGIIVNARDVTARHEIEERLAHSERYHRALIENALDIVTVTDPAGITRSVSDSIEPVLGWKPAELVGRSVFEFVHPDDLARVAELFARRAPQTGARDVAELRMVHRDGSVRHLEVVGESFVDDPVVAGVVFNSRDVTARRLAEAQLAEQQRRFRALIENSLDVITVLDASARRTYVSPSVERVLGWSPEELMGTAATQLIHPDDVPRVAPVILKILQEPGGRATLQFRVRHKDGSWRHSESVGQNLLHDPAVGGIVINSRDVTARRLAEERLAEREAFFRAVLGQVTDAVTVIEPDGLLRFLSPSVRKILGYEPEELVGTPLLDLVHPDDRSTIAAAVAGWPTAPELESGSAPALFRARHKDGSWRYLEGTGRISFDDPVVHGVVGSVRDVSDRVAADEERERLFRGLAEAMDQVKLLQGLLPICSSCKRVRDDQGYWTQIEAYVAEHSEAKFSHGICPRCAKDLYPDYFADKPTDEIG